MRHRFGRGLRRVRLERWMVEHQYVVGAIAREQLRVARDRGWKTHRDERAAEPAHKFIALREQLQTAARNCALEVGFASHPQITPARRLAYRGADRAARLAVAPERAHLSKCRDHFA